MTQADSVHSTPPTNTSAVPADSLYLPTDISPEQLFEAVGRLRREAQDEIERLLTFLDQTEPDPDLEDDPSGIADYDGLGEQVGSQDWQHGAMA